MKKNLVWRLSKLPTPDEVRGLVQDKIITNEEAREILFGSEDTKALKDELKFLRELVEKLSTKEKIVESIRYIEKPYRVYPWYQPYQVWCGAGSSIFDGTYGANGTTYSNGSSATLTSLTPNASTSVGNSATAPLNSVKFSSINN